MKIVSRAISTIAVFKYDDGTPMPYKFKMQDDGDEEIEVKVGTILQINKSKIAGKDSLIYHCQSIIGDIEKRYELKYIIPECRWLLYKI